MTLPKIFTLSALACLTLFSCGKILNNQADDDAGEPSSTEPSEETPDTKAPADSENPWLADPDGLKTAVTITGIKIPTLTLERGGTELEKDHVFTCEPDESGLSHGFLDLNIEKIDVPIDVGDKPISVTKLAPTLVDNVLVQTLALKCKGASEAQLQLPPMEPGVYRFDLKVEADVEATMETGCDNYEGFDARWVLKTGGVAKATVDLGEIGMGEGSACP